MHRVLCAMLIGASVLSGLCVPTEAATAPALYESEVSDEVTITRATQSFDIRVGAYKHTAADTTFPLAAGETVHIRANYAPENANIDFGLIDPDGIYHFVKGEDGNIDTIIEVPDTASYRLAFRNHSGFTVKITGIVEY